MKKKIITKVRDILHTVAGFTLLYPFAKFSGLVGENDWLAGWEKFLLAFVFCTIAAGFFGAAYEMIMETIDRERKPNDIDVLRTAAGGSLVAVATLFPWSGVLALVLVLVCLAALIYDLIIYYKKKK